MYRSRSKKKQNSPETLYEESIQFIQKGEYERALTFLLKADEKLPDNHQIVWELAKLQLLLNNKKEAQKYASKAWNLGKKDRDVFLCLMESTVLPSIKLKVDFGQRLIKEIEGVTIDVRNQFSAVSSFTTIVATDVNN